MTSTTNSNSTIRDVARLAGVSVATVSRYLNQNAVISQETAQRVQDAMQTLKYTPHTIARSLATNKTNTIGLILTENVGDFFTPLIKGIESVTKRENYHLLISTTSSPSSLINSPIGPQNADGILVFLKSLDDNLLMDLYRQEYPIVLLHQTPPEGMQIPCVTIENKSAASRMVSHLYLRHNRRRIAFIKGLQDNEDATWREQGYIEALLSFGLPIDHNLMLPGDFERTVSHTSVLKLMKNSPDVDAIFCADDESAIGALAALSELNKRVPEDISVVGFDNQVLARYLIPPLTTVNAPTQQVGEVAAEKLLKILHRESVEPLTLLPTELVIRRSCGCTWDANILTP